eukprot:TRINITY_DN20033_c0_g1_i1.p1 TRINITY_DN20033_c0_g1~~TRINITY_DN20033_c0_g1_i1.p1  ORF type:complete len:179 (-),score=20.28 TRINITY_DN20033_c0_g1_i1:259-795(-)
MLSNYSEQDNTSTSLFLAEFNPEDLDAFEKDNGVIFVGRGDDTDKCDLPSARTGCSRSGDQPSFFRSGWGMAGHDRWLPDLEHGGSSLSDEEAIFNNKFVQRYAGGDDRDGLHAKFDARGLHRRGHGHNAAAATSQATFAGYKEDCVSRLGFVRHEGSGRTFGVGTTVTHASIASHVD